MGRGVVEFDKALGRNHLDLDRGEKAEGSIGPGNGVEQVRVVRAGAFRHGAVSQHKLKGDTDMLEGMKDIILRLATNTKRSALEKVCCMDTRGKSKGNHIF